MEIVKEFARPKELMEKYGISRPTLWRLVQDMKTRPKFQNAFRKISQSRELINLRDFDNYMLLRTSEINRKVV